MQKILQFNSCTLPLFVPTVQVNSIRDNIFVQWWETVIFYQHMTEILSPILHCLFDMSVRCNLNIPIALVPLWLQSYIGIENVLAYRR